MSSVTLFALCPYNEHGCFSPHMAELHTLPYPASRTAYVLASDYERDTQALRDDYNEACADAMQVAGKLQAVEAERDALRAQVEAMRALLVDAHWTVHLPTTEHAIIPRCRCRKCVISRIDAALQAKP